MLVSYASGMSLLEMMTDPDRTIPTSARDKALALAARRARREPLQHLVGTQEFWGLPFAVGPQVLIPRPESEHLVECVLDHLCRFQGARRASPVILDIGTGSGCLAVALAKEAPHVRVIASDISVVAIATARGNASQLGVESRIAWILGDALESFSDGIADIIVSNPPYIPSADIRDLEPEVRDHEPRAALDGGPDGLAVVRRIVRDAPRLLSAGGLLAVEIGAGQSGDVLTLGETAALSPCEVRHDLAGLPRVISWVKRDARHG